MQIYVVEARDTVDSIAKKLGANPDSIIFDNQLIYPYELAVGQALLVFEANDVIRDSEDNMDIISEDKTSAVAVSGYAYPFISPWVLRQTLPYISELPVFSYGFTVEGELIPPTLGDEELLISEALSYNVQPILTLTPFGMDGRFNNGLINSVVNNESYRDNLIYNLLSTVEEKKYQGVDVDFEYILPEDRDLFTEFVRLLAETLRSAGYHTSVALAPKTSADQKGLLYEGKDYKALGEVADHVLLMTYEWGYTYGPPMAVAPINQVRRVVEYALTEIPSAKIDLGIPNYGYDWPLPYERGITKARTIGNVEAVRIAIANAAFISFDETAQSPYFNYEKEGITHEVWFEDVRSLNAKFDLIEEYSLRGLGYWTIMQWFRANWELLEERFIKV